MRVRSLPLIKTATPCLSDAGFDAEDIVSSFWRIFTET